MRCVETTDNIKTAINFNVWALTINWSEFSYFTRYLNIFNDFLIYGIHFFLYKIIDTVRISHR